MKRVTLHPDILTAEGSVIAGPLNPTTEVVRYGARGLPPGHTAWVTRTRNGTWSIHLDEEPSPEEYKTHLEAGDALEARIYGYPVFIRWDPCPECGARSTREADGPGSERILCSSDDTHNFRAAPGVPLGGVSVEWCDNHNLLPQPDDGYRWEWALVPLGRGARVEMLSHDGGRTWRVHKADKLSLQPGGTARLPEDLKAEPIRLLKAAGLPVIED